MAIIIDAAVTTETNKRELYSWTDPETGGTFFTAEVSENSVLITFMAPGEVVTTAAVSLAYMEHLQALIASVIARSAIVL